MSHAPQREIRARCLEAMDAVLPLRQVIRIGSHARGDARPDSGVDLCRVADGSEKQCDTATHWLHAVWDPRPKTILHAHSQHADAPAGEGSWR